MKLIFFSSVLTVITLFVHSQGLGQSVNVDSLYDKIYASDWDNQEISKPLFEEAIRTASRYPENRASASLSAFISRQIVVLFSGVGKDSVQRVFDFCNQLLARHDSVHRFSGYILRNKGIYAMYRGDYDSAYSFYEKALELFKISYLYVAEKDKTSVIGSLASCYGNMGHAIFSTTRFDDPPDKRSALGPVMIELFMKADSLYGVCEKRNNDPCYKPAVIKVNLANTYGHYYKNAALSEQYYAEALERIERCKDSVSYVQLYNSIAYTKLSDGDTSASIAAARKAVDYSWIGSHTSKSAFSRYEANSILATIFFHKKDFQKVIEYGNAVFADSVYIRKPIDIANISGLMADVYSLEGRPEEAFRYLMISKKYLAIYNVEVQQNRIVAESNSRKMIEVIGRIERLENRIERNDSTRTIWVAVMGVSLLLALLSIGFWLYLKGKKTKFDAWGK